MRGISTYFDLQNRRTTIGREARGALATFLTMAYILFANPNILKDAGVPVAPAVAATALAAGVCCILMGLYANFPMALASGMGLNAIVAYQIAPIAGSWHTAMGLIVLDGLFVLLVVLTGLRESVMHAIPRDLRLATGAGIGILIAFMGLVNAKIVVPGNLSDRAMAVAVIGLLVTTVLMARRVTGAIVIGILLSTGIALERGVT